MSFVLTAKELKRVLFGDKTPTNMGLYAKLPWQSRVSRINTVETSINKSAFDFRDKTALKFDQDKITSISLLHGIDHLSRKSGRWLEAREARRAPADFVSVNGLIRQLQAAQMTSLKDRPEDVKDLKRWLDRLEVVATLGMGSRR
jgi:hypothetical protein